MRIIIVASVISLLFLRCAHPISKFYQDIIPDSFETTITLNTKADNTLNLLYQGCGNLILEKDGDAIITDPFFSNQKTPKLLGKIKTNKDKYAEWKTSLSSHVSLGTIKAGLIAHTHYDHIMDLPILLHDHLFTNMNVIYGNSYLPKMLIHFKNEGVNLSGLQGEQIYNPKELNDLEYHWISVTPKIRFLAIESSHAPHIGHRLFMNKPLNEKYFDDHLNLPNDKIGAFKWTTGTTYSFLVDFIDSDTLRIFIQTSASDSPNGLPPRAELQKKKVDLAFLCYASAPNVKNYPNFLLDYIQPQKVVLVHWEDFFRVPSSTEDVKLVRGTSPKKVKTRIEAMNLKKPKDYFLMPKPGTLIHVSY